MRRWGQIPTDVAMEAFSRVTPHAAQLNVVLGALDLVLVTGNTREFARVPMLSAVDWLNNPSALDETGSPGNRN
jgi:hypothetical protein